MGGSQGSQARRCSCGQANGSPFTGKTLLAGLPAGVRETEVANQAVEQYLLARGADLSDAAVLAYYTANPTQFVEDCVSVIQTTAQSTATAAYDSLKSGTSFTSAAATAAADPAGSARSGQAGCLSEASLQSQLQLTSVAVGQPVGPIQSNGTWEVFVVTSRTPVPVEQAAASIRLILTQATANQERVSKELLSFAADLVDRHQSAVRHLGRHRCQGADPAGHAVSVAALRLEYHIDHDDDYDDQPGAVSFLVRIGRGLSPGCPTPRASTWSGSGRPDPT